MRPTLHLPSEVRLKVQSDPYSARGEGLVKGLSVLQQPVVHRKKRSGGSAFGTNLAKNILGVLLNRLGSDSQRNGSFLAALASRDANEHLRLSSCQTCR